MKTTQAKGTRDMLPEEARKRAYVIERIRDAFEAFGFEPLETPAFERIETLMGKYGEDERLIFKILSRGEDGKEGTADLALRYDLTVPLARVVAQYPELPRPFKRYQIAPVWRAERPQRGRFREFYQCDVDTAGSSSPLVEIELLSMVANLYRTLGFTDFTIRLNHRQVLTSLLEVAGVPAEQSVGTLTVLDKLDKIGREGVLKELGKMGHSSEALTSLEALMGIEGSNDDILAALFQHLERSERATPALENLKAILQGLRQAGVNDTHLQLSPVLARGLGYYTGACFEVAVGGLSSSVGGGGRYDNLVGMFLGRQVPACGFSFGLERMLLILEERGLLPPCRTAVDVLIPLFGAAEQNDALSLATDLRASGLKVDVYPDPVKLGTQIQYGATRGIPFAALCGPDERARGEVMIRNLATREQQSVPRAEVGALILARLRAETVQE